MSQPQSDWQGPSPNPYPWSDDPNSLYKQFNRNYMAQPLDIGDPGDHPLNASVDPKPKGSPSHWLLAIGAVVLSVLILTLLTRVFGDDTPSAAEMQRQQDITYCKKQARSMGFDGAFESCMQLKEWIGDIDRDIERDLDRQVEDWERKNPPR